MTEKPAVLSIIESIPVTGRAIDLGSGDGRIANHLRAVGWQVEGCEIDPALAASADVEACDVLQWEPAHKADFVTCVELIEHLCPSDQIRLLRRIRTWMNSGGRVLLTTPQRHSPVAWIERAIHLLRPHLGPYQWWDSTHVSVLSRHRLEWLLSATGFVIEDRIGVHYVPELVPIRRLHHSKARGRLGALGWDLIYLLR